MNEQSAQAAQSRATTLVLALVVTIAARAIPAWSFLVDRRTELPAEIVHDLVLLAMGLCLALSAPRRSGLCVGTIREHWRGVLLVCALPVLVTAVVYPNLAERPFGTSSWSMWAISPLAQDLIFVGFLYGWFERAFAGGKGISRALLLTALFFALWHLPNLGRGMSPGFVAFQMVYTAVGLLVVGLSRQWTGSILYAVATHTAVNAIAWLTS